MFQNTLAGTVLAVVTSLALALVGLMPLTMHAESEVVTKEDAEEAVDDAAEAIAEAIEHIAQLEDDGDDVESLEEYLGYAEGYLEDAEDALDEDQYLTAVEYAEKAEDKVEDHIIDEDEDEEKEESEEKCEGAGEMNFCKYTDKDDDDKMHDKKESDHKMYDSMEKSDQDELRMQLRQLLLLLIELLQKQAAL